MFTVSELFDLAIQVEVNGERFYRYAMERVKGDSLKNLLGWLADRELLHESAFMEIKERIVLSSFLWKKYPKFEQNILNHES